MFAHIQHEDFPKGLVGSWKALGETKILHLQSTLCEVAVKSCFTERGCNLYFNLEKKTVFKAETQNVL